MYSVVKFVSEGSVQVVPSSWISQDKSSCKWPLGPCANLSTLIKQGKPPLPPQPTSETLTRQELGDLSSSDDDRNITRKILFCKICTIN